MVARLGRIWRQLRGRRPTTRIVVNADAVVVCIGDAQHTRIEVDAERTLGEALRQAVAAAEQRRVEFALETSLVRIASLGWNSALTSSARWRALACVRLEGGADAAGNPGRLDVRVASTLPPRNRLAVGVEHDIVRQIATAGGTGPAIRLALLDRLNALLAAHPKFTGCVIDAGTTQAAILVLRAGEVVRVRRRRLSPDLSDEQVASAVLPTVRSEWVATGDGPLAALAACGPRATAVAVASAAFAPPPRILALTQRRARGAYDFDLARRADATPQASWFLLGAGLAAAVLAVLPLRDAWEDRSALVESIARLQAALDGPASASAETAQGKGRRPTSEDADALQVVGDLNRPWRALFDGIESAQRPEVRVRQVAIDSNFSRLTMGVEAKSLADVLAYSAQLGELPPIGSIQLVHHEWTNVGGVRVLSARLSASLKPAPLPSAAGPLTPVAPVAAGERGAAR
jgi:hypothetical protein